MEHRTPRDSAPPSVLRPWYHVRMAKKRGAPPAGCRWVNLYLPVPLADALRRAALVRRETGAEETSQGAVVADALRLSLEIEPVKPRKSPRKSTVPSTA